jgi:hypothetical protein
VKRMQAFVLLIPITGAGVVAAGGLGLMVRVFRLTSGI